MSTRRQIVIILTTLMTIGTVQAQPPFSIAEQVIGTEPLYTIAYANSADGRHCLAVESLPDHRARVYLDGKVVAEYDGIREAKAMLGPNGKRWACRFITTDYSQVFVIDGAQQSDKIGVFFSAMAFSPDGKRLAYLAEQGDRRFVMLDGKKGPELGSEAVLDELVFSPDGKRLAYDVRGENPDYVMLDGKPGPGYANVYGLEFSSDSKRFLYTAEREDGMKVVVLDGKAGQAHDDIYPGPIFSPDGRHVAYCGRDRGKCRVYLDGKPGPEYDDVGLRELVFSGDSRVVGYTAKSDGIWKIVLGNEEKYSFDDGSEPHLIQLNKTGDKVSYALEKGGQWVVMYDTFTGPVHDLYIERLVLSPDGKRVGYVVKTYGSTMRAYESWAVVVDGEKDPECAEIMDETFSFSPDSRHYAYFIRCSHRNDHSMACVYDGSAGRPYASLVKGGPAFNPDGSAEFLAVDGDTLFRVKYSPK